MTEVNHPSNHPPLPPTTEEDRISWLRLLRSRRVGPSTFHRLLAEAGNIQDALVALTDLAHRSGAKNYTPCPVGVVEVEMASARNIGARLICLGDPDYPALLADIPNAPPALWARGNTELLRRRSIALVGARNASSLGLRMARALGRDLSEGGHTVTSGLARGIDTAAHEAALAHGTIAVMAGGVDVVYPAENANLGRRIAEIGLILSEQPMGLHPQARHFPSRNRIISGLSEALVVIEAAAKSGSLITARAALDQGREVLAVPGHPFDARASGCNMLIRDGALLVRSGEDVREALQTMLTDDITDINVDGATPLKEEPHRPASSPKKEPQSPTTRALHQSILDRLGAAPLPEDQLIRDLNVNSAHVAPTLTDLELQGKITRHAGGLLSRRS